MLLLAALLVSPAATADDPLSAIGRQLEAGQIQEARAAAQRLRDTYRAQSDRSNEAIASLLLGLAGSMLQDEAAARTSLQNASAKFTELGDVLGQWMALYLLAHVESSNGQFQAAIAIHDRIAVLLREAADPKVRLSPDTFKIFGAVSGTQADARGPIAGYPDLFKPFFLAMINVVSNDAHAGALIDMGELEKADARLDEAFAAGMILGGMFDSTLDVRRGMIRERQWRLDEARESYTKALARATATPTMSGSAAIPDVSIMRRMANLEVLRGRTDEGLMWNDRALQRAREAHDVKLEIDLIQDRGTLLQNGGRFDRAIGTFGEALALAAKSADAYRMATIHADLGLLHKLQGTYGSSLEHLEKSLELLQGLNQPYFKAPGWLLLAEMHMLLGSYDGVDLALDKARALAKKSRFQLAEAMVDMMASGREFLSGKSSASAMDAALRACFETPGAAGLAFTDATQKLLRASLGFDDATKAAQAGPGTVPGPPIVLAMSWMIQGKVLLDRGEYAGARERLQQALATHPNRDHRAALLALIGTAYWREANRKDAIRYFRQAADTLDATADDVKVEELLAAYLGSNRHVYFDLLIELLVDEGHTDEAFAQAERARARAFLQMIGNHRLSAEGAADPQLVQEAEALRTHLAMREREARMARPEEAKSMAADLQRERQQYLTVLTRVKVSNPEYGSLTSVEPLQIQAVQSELPPDVTLISYFISPSVVHAWTVSSTAAAYTALPVDSDRLRRIVCWATQLGPPANERGILREGRRCTDRATPEEAFDALIAPLQQHVRTTKLIIVPHGVLHYVPFAALRDPKTGCHLVESYTLTYAPSASTLPFLRSKETPLTGGALVLGDPASPLPGLEKLPGAKQEATAIAQSLGTTAHLGADAREALLYDAGAKADLVHLAAHGSYDAANPLFSRIALAPDDAHDGSLTVHEILSSLDLKGVNLVVLSACRSAVGARSGGDEVVGLTRALLYAGTPGVISTLWNIDDAASAGLMNAFYRRLGDGLSVADALRQAQLEVMHSELYRDPKYWAGFTLTGDPQARWQTASRSVPSAAEPQPGVAHANDTCSDVECGGHRLRFRIRTFAR